MSITTQNKINNTSSPLRETSTTSTNVALVIFDELKQQIEEKFEAIENKITCVEKHMKDQHQELQNLIQETENQLKLRQSLPTLTQN